MKPQPIIRPATKEDVARATAHLYGQEKTPPVRVLAYVGEVDGRVICVGGVAFYADGQRIAFCDIDDEGRKYPLSLHRGAKMAIAAAHRFGVRKIIVCQKGMHEKTPRWLAHLGFRPMQVAGEMVYASVDAGRRAR